MCFEKYAYKNWFIDVSDTAINGFPIQPMCIVCTMPYMTGYHTYNFGIRGLPYKTCADRLIPKNDVVLNHGYKYDGDNVLYWTMVNVWFDLNPLVVGCELT